MSQNVDFGQSKPLGFCGLLAGAAIAIGVPWVVLSHAGTAGLGGISAALLSVLGVVGGVVLAVVAISLSIVIPRKVQQ